MNDLAPPPPASNVPEYTVSEIAGAVKRTLDGAAARVRPGVRRWGAAVDLCRGGAARGAAATAVRGWGSGGVGRWWWQGEAAGVAAALGVSRR